MSAALAKIPMLDPNGPAGCALASLSSSQRSFLENLPKVELHAHLNGCIPLPCLQALAREFDPGDNLDIADSIRKTLSVLASGAAFDNIRDWFGLFPAIYALTSTPAAVQKATEAVLESFLGSKNGLPPQCSYIELRTTPRATPHMTRRQYLLTVLNEVLKRENAALIVSIDRRMDVDTAKECVELAIALKDQGLPVVCTLFLLHDPWFDFSISGRH
jgi:adenosine deaminase